MSTLNKTWVFKLPAIITIAFLVCTSSTKVAAQEDWNRRLDVAVNGFEMNQAAAKLALSKGADINYKNEAMGGETMLISAIKGFKEPKVIKFLIDNGASPSIKDNSGKTALEWAHQYNIGRDNNGRQILSYLTGNTKDASWGATRPPAQQQTIATRQPAAQQRPVAPPPPTKQATTSTGRSKTAAGGPSINEIKQVVEKTLTKDYDHHFFGVTNKVNFEWLGGITVGQQERRLRLAVLCYPVKLNVKVTATDPRDGNKSTVARGTEADIAGYHKTEIFCFYKNGFGQWEYGTYEQ
jgi:hypothetical protein